MTIKEFVHKKFEKWKQEGVDNVDDPAENWLTIFCAPEGGIASSISKYGDNLGAYSFDVPHSVGNALNDFANGAKFEFYVHLPGIDD